MKCYYHGYSSTKTCTCIEKQTEKSSKIMLTVEFVFCPIYCILYLQSSVLGFQMLQELELGHFVLDLMCKKKASKKEKVTSLMS